MLALAKDMGPVLVGGNGDAGTRPYTLVVPGERDAAIGSVSTSASRGSGSTPGPAVGAPAVHRASHRAPSPGACSLSSPCGSRERTLGPHSSDSLPITPWPAAVARGASEVHSATLGRPPGTGGEERSPAAPPSSSVSYLPKLSSHGHAAMRPSCCTTPSRRTGPSVASRHAARFLHRPLRKAPLYPRFGGFSFFPCLSPAARPRPLCVRRGIELCPFSAAPPRPRINDPWDGSGGSAGAGTPSCRLQRGDWAGQGSEVWLLPTAPLL